MADVAISGAVVLDLGCGHGWNSQLLAAEGQAAHVIGVDVKSQDSWNDLRSDEVQFVLGDLAQNAGLVAPESVDVVYSTVVFEHVRRPVHMLNALHQVLRPGGRAWLRINLHPGISASHAYRRVYFPWPHLLFDEQVARAYFAGRHGFAWVNYMTLAHYLTVAGEAGLGAITVRRDVVPIDVAFFQRFEDRLGRYTALDLETNYVNLVLERTASPPQTVMRMDYFAREVALEAAIRDGRAHTDPG